MTEGTLRPGTICTGLKEGAYQIVATAKERNSGEEMIVYQQLFSPFTVYTETVERFLDRVKQNSGENVSRRPRETNGETTKRCETSRETGEQREECCETKEAKTSAGEAEIHPEFRRFLDAKGYNERIEILKGMRGIVDNTMINSMAVLLDTEIKDGPVGDRFDELLEFMQMKGRYEIDRY